MQTVCNTYWDAGKGNLTAQNTRKPFGGRGFAPDPAEGAYRAPTNPQVGGRGWLSPPKNPIPALGPSGLASSTPTPKLVPTPLNLSHLFTTRHRKWNDFSQTLVTYFPALCWWIHVSKAQVLQRSVLSTVGDILRHRRLMDIINCDQFCDILFKGLNFYRRSKFQIFP